MNMFPRDNHATCKRNALIYMTKLSVGGFIVLLQLNQRAQQALYFGQERFSFEQSEITWH